MRDIQNVNKENQRLIKALQDISMAQTVEEVSEVVVHAVRDLVGADGANFVIRDGDLCYHLNEDCIGPLWKGQRYSMNICLSGWVMLNKQRAVIPDVYVDPRIPVDVYRPTFVKSLVMTPIRSKDPIGAIGTFWARKYQPTEEEINLIQSLADSTSVALTNVKLRDEMKNQIQELNAASKAKDEFLLMLSHELRTPLNAILGWTEIVMEDDTEADVKKVGLETILRSSKAQLKIVEDLLDSARIVSGKIKMDNTPVDINKTLSNAIEALRLNATTKAITISAENHLKQGFIKGDQGRMQQIFINLIENAIKFSPIGGKIQIKVERIGPNVQILITDSGEGITADFLPFVFDRFRQADGSMSRKYGGMGLGLAIVKDLVTLHHGTVTAESEGLGKGSTFRVNFPLATYEEAEDSTHVGPKKSGASILSKMKVMIIDDSLESRQLAEIIFKKNGAETRTAGSIREGLDVLNGFAPDLLVCDIGLPDEDGCTFIKKLRTGNYLPDKMKLPAIALTAFADTLHKDDALTAGFNAYISKPYHSQELLKTAQSLTRWETA